VGKNGAFHEEMRKHSTSQPVEGRQLQNKNKNKNKTTPYM
jgi:hypothetical protein